MAKNIQLIARGTIMLTLEPGEPGDRSKGIAPKAPKVREIKPGTIFLMDEGEAKFYTTGVKPAAEVYTGKTSLPPEEINRVKAATAKATGTSDKTMAVPEPDEGDEGDEGDGDKADAAPPVPAAARKKPGPKPGPKPGSKPGIDNDLM